MRFSIVIVVVLSLVLLSACATILNSRKSASIDIDCNVKASTVRVDGAIVGTTPTRVHVDAVDESVISVEADGYAAESKQIERYLSGWFWGNILLGGVPGMLIDWIGGGMWSVDEGEITFHLNPLD